MHKDTDERVSESIFIDVNEQKKMFCYIYQKLIIKLSIYYGVNITKWNTRNL